MVADPQFSGFLEVVRKVSIETEQELQKPLAYLVAIDQLFVEWIPDAGKVTPSTVSVLILNAHASFRAGLSLALSGQLLPVFMALRGALESALYANAIAFKPELQDIWLNRDQGEAPRKICRNEFKIKKMFDYLAEAQDPDFAESVRDAYDSTIDFGAHPNSQSMLRSVTITEGSGGDHALDFTYVHGPHSFELRQSFVACADIGYMVFLTAIIASKGHPKIKALNEKALSIRDDLPSFIRELGFSHPQLEVDAHVSKNNP